MTTARRRKTGQADAPGLQIELDGRTYTVRQSDITPQDVRALRQATGFSWAGLGRELGKDPDIDLVAALVWFARRIEGDRDVTYDDVLNDLSYDSDLNVKVEDKRAAADDGDPDSPEA